MAYENTHLYIAEKIRKLIGNNSIKQVITSNLNQYYLGSIFPDTLSYSRKSKIKSVASYLHGSMGIPTNDFVFKMLNKVKKNKEEKGLSFIYGFLTHCAVDIIIHPVINYFSEYNPKGTKREKEKTSYLHWHLETYFDTKVNKSFYLEDMIRINYLDGLGIEHILNIPLLDIKNALKRQISYFRLTRSKMPYRLFKILSFIGIIPKSFIGGFYENLKYEKTVLPDNLIFKDIITGEKIRTNQMEIVKDSVELGKRMIETAYEYYTGNINRIQSEKIINGNNLDTGHYGKTKSDIRFVLDNVNKYTI